MSQTYHQLRRLFDLIKMLPEEPQNGYTVKYILEHTELGQVYLEDRQYSAAQKQLERDFQTLENNWPDVIARQHSDAGKRVPAKFVRKSRFLRDYLDAEMAVALLLSKSFLDQAMPEMWLTKLDSVFEAAEEVLDKNTRLGDWTERLKVVPATAVKAYTADNEECIEVVMQALATGQPCEIVYARERDGAQRTFRILPKGLVIRGAKRLLLAVNLEKGYTNTFALHRLVSAHPTEPELWDQDDAPTLEEMMAQAEYEPAERQQGHVTIRLLCSASLRAELDVIEFEHMQPVYGLQVPDEEDPTWTYPVFELEGHSGNYVLAAFRGIVTQSFEDWLWQHSDRVTVLEPEFLRDRLEKRLADAQSRHQQHQDTATLEALLQKIQPVYENEDEDWDAAWDDEEPDDESEEIPEELREDDGHE